MVRDNIKHVAIIMDGNGRWAQERSHSRLWGHVRGSAVVSDIVEESDKIGIEALTLYAFSTENWGRPLLEINTLFALLRKFLDQEKVKIIENRIRFKVMGEIAELPRETKELIAMVEEATVNNKGLKLTFAFGYGGRSEIIDTIKALALKKPVEEITIEDVNDNLYVSDLGDVDLLIRTGGDQRISNFLLWQIAYSEIYFCKTKWPDFKREEFRKIIQEVSQRERRFGLIRPNDSLHASVGLAKRNRAFLNPSCP